MPGSPTPRGPVMTHHLVMPSVAFRHIDGVSTPDRLFRRSMSGLRVPLSTLRCPPHDRHRMTRGQCGWLSLHCRDSASPTSRRFVPSLLCFDPQQLQNATLFNGDAEMFPTNHIYCIRNLKLYNCSLRETAEYLGQHAELQISHNYLRTCSIQLGIIVPKPKQTLPDSGQQHSGEV